MVWPYSGPVSQRGNDIHFFFIRPSSDSILHSLYSQIMIFWIQPVMAVFCTHQFKKINNQRNHMSSFRRYMQWNNNYDLINFYDINIQPVNLTRLFEEGCFWKYRPSVLHSGHLFVHSMPTQWTVNASFHQLTLQVVERTNVEGLLNDIFSQHWICKVPHLFHNIGQIKLNRRLQWVLIIECYRKKWVTKSLTKLRQTNTYPKKRKNTRRASSILFFKLNDAREVYRSVISLRL